MRIFYIVFFIGYLSSTKVDSFVVFFFSKSFYTEEKIYSFCYFDGTYTYTYCCHNN